MSGLSRSERVATCPDACVPWDRVQDRNLRDERDWDQISQDGPDVMRAGPRQKLARLSRPVPCPALVLTQKVNFRVGNTSRKNQMIFFQKCTIK